MDHEAAKAKLSLPLQIISPTDVHRLIRELEAVEEFLHQASVRQAGVGVKLPRTSKSLDDFALINKLNFLQPEDRASAIQFLTMVNKQAPTIHISFAADPSATFIGKITLWLRTNIHPNLLLRIGLEPSIAAGCIVRTPNKQFDFSLRQHFSAQRETLISLLNGETPKGVPK